MNKDFTLDYREDKSKNLFFQRHLDFSDICADHFYQPVYYNVLFKYKCDSDLKRNEPIIKVITDRCKIEIEIFMKEACKYTKLPIDNFFNEYKYIICFYYFCFALMVISLNEFLTHSVAYSFGFIIISFILLFMLSLNEFAFIIPFILSIFISIAITYLITKKYPNWNHYILFSVSGFTFGQIIVQLIFSYFKLINIFEISIIIIISIIAFIFLSFKLGYIFGSFILFSYFISNIFIIWFSKKLPILTIIFSLIDQGFNIQAMEKFIYKKYYIYYSIYSVSFILLLILRLVLSLNKNFKFSRNFLTSVFSTSPTTINAIQHGNLVNENENENDNLNNL